MQSFQNDSLHLLPVIVSFTLTWWLSLFMCSLSSPSTPTPRKHIYGSHSIWKQPIPNIIFKNVVAVIFIYFCLFVYLFVLQSHLHFPSLAAYVCSRKVTSKARLSESSIFKFVKAILSSISHYYMFSLTVVAAIFSRVSCLSEPFVMTASRL